MTSVTLASLTPANLARITDTYSALYDAASADVRLAGMLWYERANATADRLALFSGKRTETACGVIAALSPRMPWPHNKLAARDVLNRGTMARRPAGTAWHTTPNLARALTIRTADAVPFGTFRADSKTESFFCNLLWPYTSDSATLDAWMFRAVGLPESAAPKPYALVADCVYRAAGRFDLLPHQVQATVWLMARDVYKLRKGQSIALDNGRPYVVDSAGRPVPVQQAISVQRAS